MSQHSRRGSQRAVQTNKLYTRSKVLHQLLYRCMNLHLSENRNTSWILSGLRTPYAQAATLQAALQHFTAAEVLDGANRYRCPKNGELVRAQKRITIEEAPNVLVVHLKRFDFFGRGERSCC